MYQKRLYQPGPEARRCQNGRVGRLSMSPVAVAAVRALARNGSNADYSKLISVKCTTNRHYNMYCSLVNAEKWYDDEIVKACCTILASLYN
jgi:hypothetical protein